MGAVLFGHVHLAAAGGEDIEDAVKGLPIIGPRPSGAGLRGQKGCDELPLLLAQLPKLHLCPPSGLTSYFTPARVLRQVHCFYGIPAFAGMTGRILNAFINN